MRLTSFTLATALSSPVTALRDCQGKETAIDAYKIQYTIDPTITIFNTDKYLPDILTSLRVGGFNTNSTTGSTAKINNILNSTCTMNIEAQGGDEISATEMMRLFSASLGDSDLLCHTPSHKIGSFIEDRHTMLSTHFKVLLMKPNVAAKTLPFMEYSINCPPAMSTVAAVGPARIQTSLMRDCEFCKQITTDLKGMCSLKTLGKLASEEKWIFGSARCEGCAL